MAEKLDCEGNIISPLGVFKKIPPVSPACVVQLPVSLCSPPPCTALTTSTTVSYSTQTAFTLTSPSPVSVISVTSGSAKPPVMGGVRGYEYVSFDDLNMIYSEAVKLKKERDLTLEQNLKLKKMLKSRQRREKTKQLPRLPAPIETTDNASQVEGDTTTVVSSVTSSWLTMLLQLRAQSSTEMQKARATIATQAKQMVDKKREIKRLTCKVATLTYDNNQAHLALQQNTSGYSSSFTGSVSTTGSVFDSTVSDFVPDAVDEIVTPDVTLTGLAETFRRQEESGQIFRMLDSVDRLARQYSPRDRYHQPSHTNLSQPRSAVIADSLLNYELAALWMFAKDPTEEEMEEYEHHLEKEIRPPPIYSPRLKKPVVNWNRLNTGQYKSLPKPEAIPVEGCSQDPNFYLAVEDPSDWKSKTLRWNSRHRFPFGYRYGFLTNMGFVSVPDVPIHGYRCSEYSGEWYIDAMG